jgi:hypothetical protein
MLILWVLLSPLHLANADSKHSITTTQALLQANSHPYFVNTYNLKELKALRSLYQVLSKNFVVEVGCGQRVGHLDSAKK